MGYKIAKKDLVDGMYYLGRCRNANIARWNALTSKFVYQCYKFGETFLEEICHSKDEQRYDVFLVEEVCIVEPPRVIPFNLQEIIMDIMQAAMFLSSSILIMMGLIAITSGIVLINNIIKRFWKPVSILRSFDNYFAVKHGVGEVSAKDQ